jgi:hypothetical protein
MNHQSHNDNLHWTAFRYIADELIAEEVVAFEILLADHQDARDALARVVQLTGAMAAANPPSYATVKPSAKSLEASVRRGWLVAAIAISCLILLSVLAVRAWLPAPDSRRHLADSPSMNDSAADSNSSGVGHLVSLWASADASTISPDDAEVGGESESDGEPSEAQRFADNGQSRELTVPDWLVIAVSNESDELLSPESPEETKSL